MISNSRVPEAGYNEPVSRKPTADAYKFSSMIGRSAIEAFGLQAKSFRVVDGLTLYPRFLAIGLVMVSALFGCSEDSAQVPVAKTPPGMDGVEALVYATKGGDLDTVKGFLSQDPGLISAQDDQGNTLLHIAASYNRLEMTTYLLEQGADPEVKNYADLSASELADAEGADREVLLLLRER